MITIGIFSFICDNSNIKKGICNKEGFNGRVESVLEQTYDYNEKENNFNLKK